MKRGKGEEEGRGRGMKREEEDGKGITYSILEVLEQVVTFPYLFSFLLKFYNQMEAEQKA